MEHQFNASKTEINASYPVDVNKNQEIVILQIYFVLGPDSCSHLLDDIVSLHHIVVSYRGPDSKLPQSKQRQRIGSLLWRGGSSQEVPPATFTIQIQVPGRSIKIHQSSSP